MSDDMIMKLSFAEDGILLAVSYHFGSQSPDMHGGRQHIRKPNSARYMICISKLPPKHTNDRQ